MRWDELIECLEFVVFSSDWGILSYVEEGEDVSSFYVCACVCVWLDPPEILLPLTLALFFIISLRYLTFATVQIA